jgi:CHAT domain-containing protein
MRYRALAQVLAWVALAALPVQAQTNNAEPTHAELASGRQFMARGAFADAALTFERVERIFAVSGDDAKRISALQALAEARQALGDTARAAGTLETAIALAATDSSLRALLGAQLGGIYLQAGHNDLAHPLLIAALNVAREQRNDVLAAAVLNDIGSLHARANEPAAAREAYDEALRLASGDSVLSLRVMLNAAVLELDAREPGRAYAMAREAQRHLALTEADSYDRARELILLGSIFSGIAQLDATRRHEASQAAHNTLSEARRLAGEIGQSRLLSAANGALAGVYLQAGRREDALSLNRLAIIEAQRTGAAQLLFRWHWQAARIYRADKNPAQAIVSYRHALAAHDTSQIAPAEPVLAWFPAVPGHTVFLEFADLLLRQSATLDGAEEQHHLGEARDAVEKLKAQELRDYFRDSCVAEAQAKARGLIQSLGSDTAVLYPIVLEDRLELLLHTGTGIKRRAVAQPAASVIDAARRLRETVESQRTRAYLAPSQLLHGWLIAPIAADLAAAGIRTLVIIPDQALRNVPMAALHDGEHFLIERLSLVLSPGLELTDPRPLPARSARALITGLSESAQGFSALPHVDAELANIGAQFAGRTLKNAAFVRARLERELTQERYNIVHIASHGEFSGDVRKSYILTHDGNVSVDDLANSIGFNRLRDDPLDLLTLSACQSAVGDERAALGIAGLAVKAGARSALASLWPIHDEATALLMTEFYVQLRKPGVGKALALQRAQQKLAAITRYRHPGYWAGFVLIGNWL